MWESINPGPFLFQPGLNQLPHQLFALEKARFSLYKWVNSFQSNEKVLGLERVTGLASNPHSKIDGETVSPL